MHNQPKPSRNRRSANTAKVRANKASTGTPNRGGTPRKNSGGRKPQAPMSNVWTAMLWALMTIGACVFLAVFILSSASDLFGLNQDDKDYNITIVEGTTLSDAAKILKDSGVIDQRLTFGLYSGLKAKGLVPRPGDYVFNSNYSYDQILTLLKNGNARDEIVNITFPEGMTVDDIAARLEENRVCDADEFLEYLQNADFSDYWFIDEIPQDKHLYLRMEGYLFPDTYDFYVGENMDQVARKFFDNFERHISDEMKERMEIMGLSLHEVITLASIIEKEAGGLDEVRKVSSVFYNRLKNPSGFPRLESDVTIFYANDHIKGRNRTYTVFATQEVLDAYNTYVAKGLPVGPVCNPGVDSIMAALHPPETDFYYFVTDVEGEYYYATTLEQHLANIEVAESQDETGEGRIAGGILTHDVREDEQR